MADFFFIFRREVILLQAAWIRNLFYSFSGFARRLFSYSTGYRAG